MGEFFKFSKIAATGTRVPLNTHAPLRLPGMLSTAGHCDQSRLAMFIPSFHRSFVPRFGASEKAPRRCCRAGKPSVFVRQKERRDAAVGFGDDPKRVFPKAFARLRWV